MASIRITPPAALRMRVTARGRGLQLGGQGRPVAVVRIGQGLTGAPGTQGLANISADAGNRIVLGSDGRLLVLPEGAPLSAPRLTWDAGRVAQVDYADGSVRTLIYVDGRLQSNELMGPGGAPVTTKTYTYNPDGTLAAVNVS